MLSAFCMWRDTKFAHSVFLNCFLLKCSTLANPNYSVYTINIPAYTTELRYSVILTSKHVKKFCCCHATTPQGLERSACREGTAPPVSPQRPRHSARPPVRIHGHTGAVQLAARQLQKSFHTHANCWVVVSCSLLSPKAGASPLCWDKSIPFCWILCIVSHGLEQVIPNRHSRTEKLLVLNIYLQTAAGLAG